MNDYEGNEVHEFTRRKRLSEERCKAILVKPFLPTSNLSIRSSRKRSGLIVTFGSFGLRLCDSIPKSHEKEKNQLQHRSGCGLADVWKELNRLPKIDAGECY